MARFDGITEEELVPTRFETVGAIEEEELSKEKFPSQTYRHSASKRLRLECLLRLQRGLALKEGLFRMNLPAQEPPQTQDALSALWTSFGS